MAWGYEASFTVEHDNTLKRTLSCKDCVSYDKTDKSCRKNGRYIPLDGFDSWKDCGTFEIDPQVSHLDEKEAQYRRWVDKKARHEAAEKRAAMSGHSKGKKGTVPRITLNECKHLKLTVVRNSADIPLGVSSRSLIVMLPDGTKEVVLIYKLGINAYVEGLQYSRECVKKLKEIFN